MIEISKYLTEYRLIVTFILHLVSILIFNAISCYFSKVFLVVFTSVLSGLFTYKLFVYILKLAFYNNDKCSQDLVEYHRAILFENEILYKLIFDRNFNKKKVDNVDEAYVRQEIRKFIHKFRVHFIDIWYIQHVSDNQLFPLEAEHQLELLFFDLFKRLSQSNKLDIFRKFAILFDNNLVNLKLLAANSDEYKSNLHPAICDLSTEISYMKKCVQLIMYKSCARNSYLNQLFAEEFFLQILGKNCLQKLVDTISQPNFLFYSIILLCGKTYDFDKIDQDNPSAKADGNQVKQSRLSLKRSSSQTDKLLDSKGSKQNEDEPFRSINIITEFDEDVDEFHDSVEFKELNEEPNEDNANNENDDLLMHQELHQKESIFFNKIGDIDTLIIDSTETAYELKTKEPYTLYNICVKYSSPDGSGDERYIKKRFKQFVDFHDKLKDNPYLKMCIRNIKGPSNLFTLPFGKMEEQNIQNRREKLNNYLNQLIKIPEIRLSEEFTYFLKNENTNNDATNFTKNLDSTDNVLIRTVSGMFGKISSTTAALTSIIKIDDSNLFNSVSPLDYGKIQAKFEYVNKPSNEEFQEKITNFLTQNQTNVIANDIEISNIYNDCTENPVLLSKLMVDIFVKIMLLGSEKSDCYLNNQNFYMLIKEFCNEHYLERFLDKLLKKLFSEKKLIDYLHLFENILFEKSNSKTSFAKKFMEYNPELERFAFETIQNLVPNIVKFALNKQRFERGLQTFFDLIKDPVLNRHFSYCLLDMTLSILYKEEFCK